MRKLFLLFIIPLFISACTLKKVENHHGVHFLNKKQERLKINQSNKNDIIKLLGNPSTKSAFDNDLWIYIEREKSISSMSIFQKQKIIKNHILLLEVNNLGLLEKKTFLNLNDMNDIKIAKNITIENQRKKTFIYDFLSSMRQKINDPLGKRKK